MPPIKTTKTQTDRSRKILPDFFFFQKMYAVHIATLKIRDLLTFTTSQPQTAPLKQAQKPDQEASTQQWSCCKAFHSTSKAVSALTPPSNCADMCRRHPENSMFFLLTPQSGSHSFAGTFHHFKSISNQVLEQEKKQLMILSIG